MGRWPWNLLGGAALGIAITAAAEGGAQFINPLSTQLGIDVYPANVAGNPGISRVTNGSGPLSDSGSMIIGLNSRSTTRPGRERRVSECFCQGLVRTFRRPVS